MNKYRNIKTVVDGITFDSKREAFYYQIFKKQEQLGHIKDLKLQVPFHFVLNGKKIFTYKADFTYINPNCDNYLQVVDVKGVQTPVFKLKKKLIEAQHGIIIDILK